MKKMKKLGLCLILTLLFIGVYRVDISAMEIFVKFEEGQPLHVEVEPTDRVEEVKEKIKQGLEIPTEHQILIFAGKRLEDGNTLQDYSIQRDSTIHLTVREVNKDFLSYQMKNYIYDGTKKEVLVQAKEDIKKLGEISVKYNGNQEVPMFAGEYKVTADIVGGKIYEDIHDLELGVFKILPKEIKTIKNRFQSYQKGELEINHPTLEIKSEDIIENDQVYAEKIQIRYPSTQEIGLFHDATIKIESLNNTNYRINNTLSNQSYEVISDSIISIKIISPPKKTTYKIGETIDLEGTQVECLYESGRKEVIDDISQFILSSSKIQKLDDIVFIECFQKRIPLDINIIDNNNDINIIDNNNKIIKTGDTTSIYVFTMMLTLSAWAIYLIKRKSILK